MNLGKPWLKKAMKPAPPPPPPEPLKVLNGEILDAPPSKLYSIPLRKKAGRPRVVEDGDELISRFEEFVRHQAANPIEKPTQYSTANGVINSVVKIPRPLTLISFRMYLGISQDSWYAWRKGREDLQEAIEFIEDAVYDQKLQGAAAGLYKENIIARHLGLGDKAEVTAKMIEPPKPPVDAMNIANCIHPDDPDPTGPNRPLYSPAQIEAGMPFLGPK